MTTLEQDIQREQQRYKSGSTYREIPVREKLKFEIHITEHCNLNCKYCNHFSPLAEEKYLSLEEYERDLARLSLLFDGQMQQIKLLGGEPLLHPEVNAFMEVSRKYFTDAVIKILTNGTLLLKMNDEFWKTCYDTGTSILYSKYPIPYDEKKMKERALKFQVPLEIAEQEEGKEYGTKTMVHEPVDISGKQNAIINFYACTRPNYCITLKHGKLYTCNRAAHMHIFRDYFGLDIKLDEADGIDIYKAETAEEILEYMTKPIPMCAYCDIEHITMGHEWGISKKDISEWI